MAPHAEPHFRASDAERDAVAERIRNAAGEGRLDTEELDARLEQVYAATYRHELDTVTSDLPAPISSEPKPPARSMRDDRALRIHVVVVAALAVFIVARWAFSGAAFFWPVFPLFWLTLSVVIHALVRRSRGGPGRPHWGGPALSAREGR